MKQHNKALQELSAKKALYDQKMQKYETELKAYNKKTNAFNRQKESEPPDK
ncbi:MAG: hypothetical protein AB7S75_05350 [Desulfococcaceae bacterium]